MQILLCFLIELASFSGYTQASSVPDLQKKVSVTLHGQTILQALIQLGLSTQVPIGIEIATEGSALCKQREIAATFTDVTMAQVVKNLLSGTDYTWREANGAVGIRPGHIPEADARVLNIKFEKFGGMPTTIQGLGIILAGWIGTVLHPGQGYAGDILSSSDAEKIPPFTLRNASVEEILNHIVSLGGKGVWILYPPKRADEKKSVDVTVRAFGYKDDKKALETLSCAALFQ